jgi:hypothetical protein
MYVITSQIYIHSDCEHVESAFAIEWRLHWHSTDMKVATSRPRRTRRNALGCWLRNTHLEQPNIHSYIHAYDLGRFEGILGWNRSPRSTWQHSMHHIRLKYILVHIITNLDPWLHDRSILVTQFICRHAITIYIPHICLQLHSYFANMELMYTKDVVLLFSLIFAIIHPSWALGT